MVKISGFKVSHASYFAFKTWSCDDLMSTMIRFIRFNMNFEYPGFENSIYIIICTKVSQNHTKHAKTNLKNLSYNFINSIRIFLRLLNQIKFVIRDTNLIKFYFIWLHKDFFLFITRESFFFWILTLIGFTSSIEDKDNWYLEALSKPHMTSEHKYEKKNFNYIINVSDKVF